MAVTDLKLIEATKSGDSQAFGEIIKRYESKVAATVIGMLGEGQEAEDVGQEVFIRFYKSINRFRGDAQLGTYLTRIAINLSINTLKRQKRRTFLRFDHTDSQHLLVPDHHLNQEQMDTKMMVQTALSMLPADFRAVIVLRLIDGYSTKETAEILNIPLGTVLSRLTRAQKKLKSLLEMKTL